MNEYKEQLILFWKGLKPFSRVAILSIIFCLGAFLLIKSSFSSESRIKSSANSESFQIKSKGFELFDEGLWMKGDKELEILNLRALKGQLERDLLSFESVEKVTVILDAPLQDLEELTLPKASIILKLFSERALSPMEIQSILYYLTGAVKNLKPHRIAISDSLGRLYTEILEEPSQNTMTDLRNLKRKEELKASLEQLLLKIFRMDSFSCIWTEKESQKLSVKIVVDEKNFQKFRSSLSLLLDSLYKEDLELSIHPFDFQRESLFFANFSKNQLVLAGLLLICLIAGIFLLKGLLKKEKIVEKSLPAIESIPREISLEKERPKLLLETFSNLNLAERELFIESLSLDDRSELLLYLSKDGEES